MTTLSRMKAVVLAAGLTVGLGTALPAAAVDLDTARTQGLVGERPDGLIGAVQSSVTPDVKALVDSVNAARMREYRSIADKNGTPLDAVQAVAGEKQIEKAKQNK
ncbi:MAG: YdbL family protein, partial [Rhodospirillaceae bacterium]|nr:YdbL family protein [Rhodospirillaceae bacterium]